MSDPLGEYVEEVRADPDSLGLLLHGSRGSGVERAGSDYDLIRVVADAAYEARSRERRHEKLGAIDVLYESPQRLRRLAESPGWWTATYADARVLVDATGELEPLVRAMVERAGEAAWNGVAEAYDSYLNSWVRSLKAWRGDDALGGRLHAAESALHLVRTLFGLARRWPPYHDRLAPQLPGLEAELGWEQGSLAPALQRLLDGEPAFQQELEQRVEELLAARGFAHEWGGDLEPLKALRFD